MKRTLLLAVAVLVLAGCAPAPTVPTAAPTAPVVETPSATPTPQPTQEPETGLVQPAQVFDGDCGNLLTNADASAALGSPVKRAPRESANTLADAIVWQAGGLTCGWNDPDYSFGMTVTAAPVGSVATLEPPLVCGTGYVEFAPDLACGVESTANGIIVSGLAWFGDGASSASKKKAKAAVTALTERIVENSTIEMSAPAPIPAADAWANPGNVFEMNPPSCTDLDAAITSSVFMGGSPRAEVICGSRGGDVYLTPIVQDLFGYETDELWTFGWYTERTKAQTNKGLLTSFDATILGGGAWMLDRIADEPGADEISIEGTDRAYRVVDDHNYVQIWAASGPNLVVGNYPPGPKDKNYISLTLVIDALNAL